VLTPAQVLAQTLGQDCHACGKQLGQPGEVCASCGQVPGMASAEAIASLHAEVVQRRAQARTAQDAAARLWADADEIAWRVQLETARIQAEDDMYAAGREWDDASEAVRAAAEDLKAAQAKADGAADFHSARARADAAARRDGSPQAQHDALLSVRAAADVLALAEAAAQEPVRVLAAAERALEAARDRMGELEKTRDAAILAAARPGPAPRSPEREAGDVTVLAENAMQLAGIAMLNAAAVEKAAEEASSAGRQGRLIVPTGAGHAAVVSTRNLGSPR